MRNVYLAFGRESFLVARSTTKRDNDYFSFAGSYASVSERPRTQQRATEGQPCGVSQEFTAVPGELAART